MERVEPATVRLATPADADILGAISGRAWRAVYPGIVPDAVLDEWIEGAPEGWHQAFVDRPPESGWRPWVAEREGAILGFATTTPAKEPSRLRSGRARFMCQDGINRLVVLGPMNIAPSSSGRLLSARK